MSLLEVRNLTYSYSKGTPFEKKALDDISFCVEKGEFIGIIGHTGSGKSTLMQMLNGLLKPDNGQVLLEGRDITSDKKFTFEARFKVGLCFQYPEYQLFEETVEKDISFGPKNMGLNSVDVAKRVYQAAEFVGIDKSLLQKSPFELSGGQKRRVAIAGVMAMLPEILILDEPAAGLDPVGCKEIMKMIDNYRTATNATVIMVTHNMDTAAKVSDRIFVLQDGKIPIMGTPKEVFSYADELISIGLDVPAATKITAELRSAGVDIPADIYTVDTLAEELTRYANKVKGGAK
jgi:energy-coupling factor transport system ATP-binding protein